MQLCHGYRPYSQKLQISDNDYIDQKENYMHILYWTHYTDKKGNKKLRLIQCSGCGVILKDSLDYENTKDVSIFPDEKYPYWAINDMERENSIWGKTNASLLYPVQDIIDDLDNSILANARLNGNPMKQVLSSSGIDPEKVDNTAGQVVTSDVVNGISYVMPPEMPSYIINRRNQALQAERQIVSRVTDQQSGVKQAGVDTATESLALQQNALKAVDSTKGIFQLILADVMMYCIELAIEYWDNDMFFESKNNKGQFDYFNPSMLKNIPQMKPATEKYRKAFKIKHPDMEVPQYMEDENKKRKIRLILTVSVGAGLPKNKALMYNIIKESFRDGVITNEEYRKLLIEYVGLPVEEIPQQAQEAQQMSAGGNNGVVIPYTQGQNTIQGRVSPNTVREIQGRETGGEASVIK